MSTIVLRIVPQESVATSEKNGGYLGVVGRFSATQIMFVEEIQCGVAKTVSRSPMCKIELKKSHSLCAVFFLNMSIILILHYCTQKQQIYWIKSHSCNKIIRC
ncbi:hypothetical protein V1478_003180 [Vespula squamosa]|uniref:Uncharacterized protein n=1 Tax=Vespula squamosa TaxID=30214 RepID=A0ABD2BS70_VESSQ